MTSLNYEWKRFWASRDGGYHLDSHGFLYQSDYFKDAVSFDALASNPCLILLGEPGIGKTFAVKNAAADAAVRLPSNEVFFFDLRSYSSEDRLYKALFENDKLKEWLAGDYRLHLFLDSLDECLLRVDTVANMLVEEFGNDDFPIHRLVLRVACRTADLPRNLEDGLSLLWSRRGISNNVGVFELCPLRQEDAQLAAEIEGVEPDAFIAEVIRRSAGTLAARPVTLRLLLNLYKNQNHLPGTAVELYENGCRLLCDEPNNSRRDSPLLRSGRSADEKLMIAGRIAAFTIFCNKAAIWKGVENGQNRPEDILVRELVGGHETVYGIRIPITEEAVRVALQTGLFTARGAETQGWSHQTFAEFLAAWYLEKRQVPPDKLLLLVSSATDGDDKPPPQLAETLSWLSSLRDDVRDHLLQTDAILLLRSDVASFTPEFRALLVEEILSLFAQEKEYDDIELHSYYARLKHPTIADQLRPYIVGKSHGWVVRRAATDIAQACDVHELQDDLVELVLDERDHIYTRINAGYAVWKVADKKTRARLKEMALEGSPTDVDLELRGVALLATWPEVITPDELFDSIVHPPIGFFGSYSMFLGRFTSFIREKELPRALRWIREKDAEMGSNSSLKREMDEIVVKAWDYIDNPIIRVELAKAVVARLRNHSLEDVIDRSTILTAEKPNIFEQADKRRSLLLAISEFAEGDRREINAIGYSKILRPRIEDLPWLFEQLDSAENQESQWFFARLIGEFYAIYELQPGSLNYSLIGETQPDAVSMLFDAVKRGGNVSRFFSPAFSEIDLDSVEASRLKEAHAAAILRKREFEEMRPSVPLLDPPPQIRVLNCLTKIEEGEVNYFWGLSQELTLQPDSQYYGHWTESDISKSPGWTGADSATQGRIIDAAKRLVLDGDPKNDDWLDENSYGPVAIAGYHALYLLIKTAPEFLSSLSEIVWRKWAPIITVFPSFEDFNQDNENTDRELHQFLMSQAYEFAPEEVLDAISRRIKLENIDPNAHFPISDKFDRCWNEPFQANLRKLVTYGTLREHLKRRILSVLLERGDHQTQEIAELPFKSFLAKRNVELEELETAAITLSQHANDGGWAELFLRVLQKDRIVGRGLVETICHYGSPAGHLSERDASDLFIWLEQEYSHKDDQRWTRGVMVGISIRQEVERWRDAVLENLKKRGTPEAVAELERISRTFSHLEWMNHVIIDAKKALRRNSWRPFSPRDFFNLLSDETSASWPDAVVSNLFRITNKEIDNLRFNGKFVRDIPALSELLTSYRDRADEFVFFVGSGLSHPLFPLWRGAIFDLIRRREEKLGDTNGTQELKGMVAKGQFLEVATLCASELVKDEYLLFLEENFDQDFTADDIPAAYSELLALQPRTIVTTNYDRIPEIGGKGFYSLFSNNDIGAIQIAIMRGIPSVFAAHGTIGDPESIVFTGIDYQKAYQGGLKGALDSIIRLKFVVFLGFGFTDPYFVPILENVFASSKQHIQGKYALLEGLSLMEIQGKEKRFGLSVIPYQKSLSSHPEVTEFIRLLRIVRGQIPQSKEA